MSTSTSVKTHGISIGIERADNRFFLQFIVHGKLTHEDYQVITPLLDAALGSVKDAKVRALVDLTEFEGWELRAAWDDFRLGLKHNNEFEKIAICGNQKWLEAAAKVGNWFTSGEIRQFESRAAALEWLQ